MSSDSEDEIYNERRLPIHGFQSCSRLERRDLEAVAKYMKSEECKNVFVMVGAGMSVSAGIPDFRSPKTGLYANLGKFNLPYAEAIFELTYFLNNPAAFYAFAADFDPSKFRPTVAHSFVRLLDSKGLLKICFTQNIDGLEKRAGIPEDKLVEAHGTITTQRCATCRAPADGDKMWECVKRREVMYCERNGCEAPVKPDIVFFGEALPERFGRCAPQLSDADLLLILGTSLKVYPFAALANIVPRECPRVLLNLERAGDIGMRPDDVLALDECDAAVRDLARLLGWEEELEKEWETTRLPGTQEPSEQRKTAGENAAAAAKRVAEAVEKKGAQEQAQDEVEKLAEDIGKALAISGSEGREEAPKEQLKADPVGDKLGYADTDEPTKKVEDAVKSEGKP